MKADSVSIIFSFYRAGSRNSRNLKYVFQITQLGRRATGIPIHSPFSSPMLSIKVQCLHISIRYSVHTSIYPLRNYSLSLLCLAHGRLNSYNIENISRCSSLESFCFHELRNWGFCFKKLVCNFAYFTKFLWLIWLGSPLYSSPILHIYIKRKLSSIIF